MVKIWDAGSMPFVEARDTRPLVSYQGGIASGIAARDLASEADTVGRTFDTVSRNIAGVAQRIRQRQDLLSLSRANSGVLNAKVQADKALQEDPDYSTWTERYTNTLTKAKDEAVKQIGDPYTRARAELALTDQIARWGEHVQTAAHQKGVQVNRASIRKQVDDNVNQAIAAPEPDTADAFLATARAAIKGGVEKNYVTPEEERQWGKEAAETFALRKIRSLPPGEQVRALGGGEIPTLTPGTREAIRKATAGNDQDADTLHRIAMLESNGNPNAVNPQSGAKGAYQFTPATAAQYGLADPTDPEASTDAASRFMADNRASLSKSLGRVPTGPELYLAHQQGAQGAAALLGSPDKPAVDVLTGVYGDRTKAEKAILQNGGQADMTAGQFAKLWEDRFNKAPGPQAPGQPGKPPGGGESPYAQLVSMIPMDKQEAIYQTALNRVHTDEARGHQQMEQIQQAFTSDFEIGLSRGLKTYSDIQDAYNKSLITPQNRTRFVEYLDQQVTKQQELAQGMAQVAAAGNGGPPLDPKDEKTRKYANAFYDQVSQAWSGLQPAEQLDRAVNFAITKGIVPEKLKGVVRGGLHSGDAQQAVIAADTLKRLRNSNPQLVGEVGDENDLRLGTLIGTYSDYGYDPQAAVNAAKANLAVSDAEKKARAIDYDGARGKTDAERIQSDKGWIEGKVNSLWTADPNVDTRMAVEFNEAAKLEYERTGNLDTSRQMALDTVSRVWGRTGVGGDLRYMKFAPEKFYSVGTMTPQENARWMNEQLLEDIGKGAFTDPSNPITRDRLMLQPNPRETAADGRPIYSVFVKGQDGIAYPVSRPDGSPLPWVPNWDSSAEKKRQDQAQRDNIDRAREMRKNLGERFYDQSPGSPSLAASKLKAPSFGNPPPAPAAGDAVIP